MEQVYLTTPFEEFKSKITEKITFAASLHEQHVSDQSQFDSFTDSMKKWTDECLQLLNGSFNNENNEYAREFKYATANSYQIPGTQVTMHKLIDEAKKTLQQKQINLWNMLRMLELSEAIAERDKVDFEARSKYTTTEKMEFLVSKLNKVEDESYYGVREILEGNGIVLKRYDEDREITKYLEDRGMVETLGGMGEGILAKLTIEGRLYVEEKNKTYVENYDDINKSQDELNNKIDEIIQRLTKLGLGQEVIFEELEELKELYPKLNKKTWGQVVKGKLVDLALAKLIEKDTLDFIYNALTDHTMRLP